MTAALTAKAEALLAARGAARADVAILQPADPFLDMAGEDLRRRIFLTENETGASLCLRPEFTIPVCLGHIAAHAATPRRYWYAGEVFRQRRDGGSEFIQAGIEDLGDGDLAAADARSLGDAAALSALSGRKLSVSLGDQSVFEAVLAALGLPAGWRMRLARAFGDAAMLETALRDLGGAAEPLSADSELGQLVAAGDAGPLSAHVAAMLGEAGISGEDGRSADEIARRMLEKAALASVRLTPKALKALREFLAIHVPLRQAPAALSAFAIRAGLELDAALSRFGARAKAIAAEGLGDADIHYDAAFGRPLDYYTGMVFEVFAEGQAKPLAGGGRYDRLLTLLGAPAPIPGVGFSAWLDRIAAAKGQQ